MRQEMVTTVLDSRIDEAARCFKEIYVEKGVPLLVKSDAAFLSFVCVITGVEALSGYRFENSNVETRFSSFIRTYFPQPYHSLIPDLWNFRNKMIHAFSPAKFALTHNQPSLHLTKLSDGRLILNADDFFNAFKTAAEKYFGELSTLDSVRSAMVMRLDDLYNGGSIGTVEVRSAG